MKIWKEFKEFAFKGNVIDMAVGVIMGGAFGKIVTSLVDNLIMPLIGLLVGDNFTSLKIVIKEATEFDEAGAALNEVALKYGAFIQQIIDFLLVAVCIFIMVKFISTLRKKAEERKKKGEEEPAEEEKKPTTEELLTEVVAMMKKDRGIEDEEK